MGFNYGDIGRKLVGKEYDSQQMRANQVKLAGQAIKDIGAAKKGPAVTTGELQDTANVSEGLGLAGAQALAQGGTGLGGGFNAAQQKGAQEGAATITAANSKTALDAIQKAKADALRRSYNVVQVGGESAWKEAELDNQRGERTVLAALEGLKNLGQKA